MNAVSRIVTPCLALCILALAPLGAASAQVQVTAADPSSTLQGTVSLDVTISGNGFDSTAQVDFLVTGTTNPGGITVKKVSVRGSKRLVATIDVADAAVVNKFDIEVTLSDGRKGKGTTLFAVLRKTTDACAAPGLDFPAFAYWKPSGKTMEILVADATGKCIRSVITSSGTGGTIQFSYPVSGTSNTGRVIWVAAPAVVGVDFTVAAGTNQISVGPKRTIYSGTGGGISLSRNGHTLYSTRFLDTGEIFIDRLGLDPVGTAAPVFQTLTTNEYIGTISVNGGETFLYADYKPSAGVSPVYQLILIPLDYSNSLVVLDSNESQREFNPAADAWSSTNRVAYQRVGVGAGGCDSLITSDVNGSIPVYPLQFAYGMKPTWVNGNVLADGRAASARSGCSYTGTIMQTDPVSGVQTALTSGYDPDGR